MWFNSCFFVLSEHLPGADAAKQLIEAIRAKKEIDDLQAILNNIPAEDENSDGTVFVGSCAH